jgi:hypothetical protein
MTRNRAADQIDALVRMTAVLAVEPRSELPAQVAIERAGLNVDLALAYEAIVDLDTLELPPDVTNSTMPKLLWEQRAASGVDLDGLDPEDLPFDDPRIQHVIRLSRRDAHEAIRQRFGLWWTQASDLAAIARAGHDLLALEPGNRDLADGLAALTGDLLGGTGFLDRPGRNVVSALAAAQHEGRLLECCYAAPFGGELEELTVRPLGVRTSPRGYLAVVQVLPTDAIRVLDATWIMSLDDAGADPADAVPGAPVTRVTATTTADVVVPLADRWMLDTIAESAHVNRADFDVEATLEVMEPVVDRLAHLLLLSKGLLSEARSFVTAPHDLAAAASTAAAERARSLLAHHGLDDGPV